MLTVSDLMSANPNTVRPETPLREVIQVMKRAECRQLPVVDEDGGLVGIVTDRDVRLVMNSPLALTGGAQDMELVECTTAGSCMTPNPITVSSDTAAYRAAEILSTYKFGALPVVDDDQLVGIITVTDFIERFASEKSKIL